MNAKLIITCFSVLLSTYTFAQANYDAEAETTLPRGVQGSAKINLDRSVTIKALTVSRGDNTYFLSASTAYDSVCKMLGFQEALDGALLNEVYGVSSQSMVELKPNGQFSKTLTHNYLITKVTCIDSAPKAVVDFSRTKNVDGSTTIQDIVYLRGDIKYQLASTTDAYANICKLLGYEEVLEGEGLNTILGVSSRYLIGLNSEGGYQNTIAHNYIVNKVTCYSGEEPELIPLVGGRRFRSGQLQWDPANNYIE